jgi:hypothetical protein
MFGSILQVVRMPRMYCSEQALMMARFLSQAAPSCDRWPKVQPKKVPGNEISLLVESAGARAEITTLQGTREQRDAMAFMRL